jgi:hypothetical protein
MLSILADTFRIASRTEQPWMRQSFKPDLRAGHDHEADLYFWRGRNWNPPPRYY